MNLCLAPIKGFTEAPYRNSASSFFTGFDAAMAPFVATLQGRNYPSSHLKDLLPKNNSGWPVIPQILSNNPEGFVKLASRLHDLGYDTVNWNLGCPFPRVAKKNRGSGLLPHPERIDRFLEKVINQAPSRLSVKTRIGRFDVAEMADLMPVFNRYPLVELIIHPRTGTQMYAGDPDLAVFKRCLEISKNPVVYNGDINTLADYTALSEAFKSVDRWMLGRGALADPFLPASIKNTAPPQSEKLHIIRQFYDRLFQAYAQVLSGPSHLGDKMKGFWFYLSRSFADGKKILKKIQKTRKTIHYKDVVNRFFDEDPKWIA
jgi:tRNA-dihydrouridine synthase B